MSVTSASVIGTSADVAGASVSFDGVTSDPRVMTPGRLSAEVGATLAPFGRHLSTQVHRVRLDGNVSLRNTRLHLHPGTAQRCTVVVLHEEQDVGLVNISLFHWTAA